jgi:prepilin-type N-terminal cleavage/methylation domain-containing protein
MSRSERAGARRARSAFTLLEVLAAVAILGILYTVLAGAAMDGLIAEGVSKRRLEASLEADRQLLELELQIDAGIVPPVGHQESEVDDFHVVVGVEPYDLVLPGLQVQGQPVLGVLADRTLDRRSPLRRIDVSVAWLEAGAEYQVRRTSFAFDVSALDPSRLPEVNPQAGAPPGPEGTPPPAEETP